MNRHMKGTLITGILALVAVAILPAAAEGQDSGVASHPMIGDQAPAFDLQEVGGGALSLEGLKGGYVVLHFGASW